MDPSSLWFGIVSNVFASTGITILKEEMVVAARPIIKGIANFFTL